MGFTPEQIALLGRGNGQFTMLCEILPDPSRANPATPIRLALAQEDVPFDGNTYYAIPFESSEMEIHSGTEINNATFSTLIASAFTRLNLKAGKWQGSKVTLMAVDLGDLAAGYAERHRGRFGQATLAGAQVEIEYRGLMQLLAQEIGERTSRLCRYQLGDSRCKKDITAFTFVGEVSAIPFNRQKFQISVSKPDGYFFSGKLTWTSGANQGLSMETLNNTGQILTLFQPMVGAVAAGDDFIIVAGDDFTHKTCYEKFDNAINFGGEPTIPDKERLFKFPDLG